MRTLVLALFFLAVGVGIGIVSLTLVQKLRCSQNFEFINEQIACGQKPVIAKHGYVTLRNDIGDLINTKVKNQEIESASIYFRDLKGGPIFGINEEAEFVPASLLKLPVVITYLNLAQDNPELLDKKLVFKLKTQLPKQQFAPSKEIKENQPYRIEDLLKSTIVYSDNRAYLVLLEYLKNKYPKEKVLLNTFKELGIIDPRGTEEETITVRAYASIFRILYNASYLSPELSDKALAMLSESKFKEGIVKGVPGNVRVAHKFGERYGLPQGLTQIHDCGIVYFPENPYTLCVMTKGKNIVELLKLIQTISADVFKEVSSRQI